MKIKHLIVMGMMAVCGSEFAHAETFSGTVTSIDATGQNVTLRRVDTNVAMTVHVSDKTALNNLAVGKKTSWEASQMGSIWEADSFIPMDSAEIRVDSTDNNNRSTNANNAKGNLISQ